MSPAAALPQVLERAPDLDGLERAAELLKAEADRLLERARAELRRRQDIEAELSDETYTGHAVVAHARTTYRLRSIARMFTRAHCGLVPPDDDRYQAACQVIGYANEADRADAPWRDAA